MTETVSVIVTTSDLQRCIDTCRRPGGVIRVVVNLIKSITEGTFSSVGASYRPSPWKRKLDGSPCILQKSSRLVHSFRTHFSEFSGTLSTDAPYAGIHQFGGKTPPHEILPRRKSALAFTSAKFGNVIVRKVNHPGSRIPPRPFIPITPDGRLTTAVSYLAERAAEREAARQAGV